MLHDEIHDTDLPDEIKESFTGLNLTPEIREHFKYNGWKFGIHVLVIEECPACKDKECPLPLEKQEAIVALADALGSDLDGFMSMLEDVSLT